MPAEAPFPDSDTLWVVHIGNDDRVALRALREGFLAIGWPEIGDLARYGSRPEMRAAYVEAYPDQSPNSVNSSYGQPYRFAHEVAEGDPVVFPVKPTGEIAVGRVTGPYRRSDDADLAEYPHVRDVEWVAVLPRTAFSQAALHSFGSFLTVSTSDDHLEETARLVAEAPPPPGPDGADGTADSTGALVRDVQPPAADTDDPEVVRGLYESAAQETEDYLLKAWRRTGHEFEHVVAATFEALGYTATVTRASGDHGVDVVAHPDPLGLEKPFVKVQVKSGTSSVGGPEVNQLKGTLNAGEQGVLVSLGKFTAQAEAAARGRADLTLIGPKRFVALFLDHYDRLAPEWRARYPLRQVYVPVR